MVFDGGSYDVIVVGVGYVGVELVLVVVCMGFKILMIIINLDMVVFMFCNLFIGGLVKGYVVCEIDVFGGEMGWNIDKIFIQMRMFNIGKGFVVYVLCVQVDKFFYQYKMKEMMENECNFIMC